MHKTYKKLLNLFLNFLYLFITFYNESLFFRLRDLISSMDKTIFAIISTSIISFSFLALKKYIKE